MEEALLHWAWWRSWAQKVCCCYLSFPWISVEAELYSWHGEVGTSRIDCWSRNPGSQRHRLRKSNPLWWMVVNPLQASLALKILNSKSDTFFRLNVVKADIRAQQDKRGDLFYLAVPAGNNNFGRLEPSRHNWLLIPVHPVSFIKKNPLHSRTMWRPRL